MRDHYSLVNVFSTIQGEGFHAGTPAVFIRLGGCNMWSGVEDHRDRDAERNDAHCPRWCDTDFRPRETISHDELLARVRALGDHRLVVISGGEPLLQVTGELVTDLNRLATTVAIETNGTVKPAWYPERHVDKYQTGAPGLWVTLSPKKIGGWDRLRPPTVLPWADELKLIVPDYNPDDWVRFPVSHRFIQPRAAREVIDPVTERDAATFVRANRLTWRLSLQTHKHLGIP